MIFGIKQSLCGGAILVTLMGTSCSKPNAQTSASDDAEKISKLEEHIKQLESQNAGSSARLTPTSSVDTSTTPHSKDVRADDLKHHNWPFTVQIYRAIIGDGAVKDGMYYESEYEDAKKKNLELVYFDVSVDNQSPIANYICDTDFTMEGVDGASYNGVQTLDGFNSTVQSHAMVRGGVGFLVPRGVYLKTLTYNSGLTNQTSGEKICCSISLTYITNRTGLVQ